MNRFRLQLLGGFELRSPAGDRLRLPTRKAEALLGYLALAKSVAQQRETLVGLLWSEAPDGAGLASLRQCLSLIGKTCGEAVFTTLGRGLLLEADRFEIDVLDFEGAVQANTAATLTQAAERYRGALLAGLSLGEPLFDDWLQARRQQLHERAVQALWRLITLLHPSAAPEQAIAACLKLQELDPLHEGGHRALMRLYASQGRRNAALQQYQLCLTLLQRELGAEPEAATRRAYSELLRQPAAEPGLPLASEPTVPQHEVPLVGRDAEMARLLQSLGNARSGRGGLVALLGEAGIGKTRLVQELTSRAVAAGTRVLIGRCHESQQILALTAWTDALRSGGIASDSPLLTALGTATRADLASLLPELDSQGPLQQGENAAAVRQARLFDAVLRTLAELCARGPLLLVLEDLHWSDELGLRLLAVAARRALGWPLLLVVTARDEDIVASPALNRTLREVKAGECAGWVQQLPLQPLSRADTAALVTAMRPAGIADQALALWLDPVWTASEGNPFVIVEAMRTVDADPSILRRTGLNLPNRVHDMIAGQLERLGPEARQLLTVLSVAGRETPFPLLQRASGLSETAAASALEELVRRRLACLSGEAFDVLHARVRQALTADLLPPTRGNLHLALAEAIENDNGSEAMLDRLAHHYAQTHHHAKAVGALVRLAQRVAHDGAHASSIELLAQARQHAAELPAAQAAVLKRDLALHQARALFFLGRFADVLALLLPLQTEIDAAADPLSAATYYLRRGSTRTYLGDHPGAMADAQRALREADACGDRAGTGKAHFLLSLEHFWAQPEQGVWHGEQACALLRDTHEQWWFGQACWILGLNLSYRGRFAEGLAMEARAAELADAQGDRRLASYAAWTTGFIHTLAGAHDAAISHCRRSLDLAVDPLNRMTTLGMLALALVEHGQAEEALRLLDEAIPMAVRFRIPQMQGLFLGFRGHARLLQGELDAARADAQDGIRITDQSGYVYGRGWSERVLARIERQRGDSTAAAAALHQAIRTFDAMGAPYEAARSRDELASWAAAAGLQAGAAITTTPSSSA